MPHRARRLPFALLALLLANGCQTRGRSAVDVPSVERPEVSADRLLPEPEFEALREALREGRVDGGSKPEYVVRDLDAPPAEALMELLSSPSPAERGGAAEALGSLAGCSPSRIAKAQRTTTAQAVARLLSDPDGDVRWDACEALASFGGDATASGGELARLLDDQEWMVRAAAARALGATKAAAQHVDSLLARLGDDEWAVWRGAAWALGEAGRAAERAVPILMRWTSNDSPWQREAAAGALGGIGLAPRQVIPVLRRLAHDTDSEVRRAAIGALGGFGAESEPQIPFLVACLAKTKDGGVREAAADALCRMGSRAEGALPKVVAVLREGIEGEGGPMYVGESVVRSLVSMGDLALPLLRPGVTDPSPWLRYHSARALLELGHTDDATRVLLDLVRTESGDAPTCCCGGSNPGQEVVKLAKEHRELRAGVAAVAAEKLRDPSDAQRNAGLAVLHTLSTEVPAECLPELVRFLRADVELRRRALDLLDRGPNGRPRTTLPGLDRADASALIECLSDKDPGVRESAARLLGLAGPVASDALPALRELAVSDPAIGARDNAREAATAILRASSARGGTD